jgi:tetratricopeptide (TPR) repeat protein
MPSAPHGPPGPSKHDTRARLDSWKEIADYLGRGERTAKRWEVERALPVHHVPGGGHGSVYAFTAELDRWLLSENRKQAYTSANSRGSPTISAASDSYANSVRATAKPSLSSKPSGPHSVSRITIYVAAFVVTALIAAYLVNVGTTHAYTPSFLRSLWNTTKSGHPSVPGDPEKQLAHDLYLRGRFEWNKRTPDSLNRALDYFTQSIVHDPTNAQAYVGLADTYNLMREFTIMPENEALTRGIAAAKKAIALDDTLAEAHRSLAFDEVWGNWDFQTGEREFQRAIELNPNDAVTHLWFANAFASPEWYPVCLREIDRAQELDPGSHAILADKGLLLFHAGQKQKGLELVQQVENADAGFLSPHRYLASMYLTLRDYPNYLIESDKTADLTHDSILKQITAAVRAGYRRDGEHGMLQALYSSQKQFYEQGKLPATVFARTCAHVGKKQEALHLLRQAYDHHETAFLMIRESLDLLALKDEPQYQELLHKLNVPLP